MPDGGASFAALLFETGVQIGAFEITTAQILAAVAVTASAQDQQRRARHQMADARSAATRDRYLMIRGATEARQIALGRQRVSGPVAFIESTGADRTTLGFVVLMSAEEVDGFEAFYIDDELAELDGSGNVLSVRRHDTYAISTATSTVTLSSEPQAGSVSAWVDYGSTRVPLGVSSVTGTSVSVSGASAGVLGTLTVQYRPAASPYVAQQVAQDAQAIFTLDGSGAGSITLPAAPVAGSVRIVAFSNPGMDQVDTDVSASTTITGAVVSVAAPAVAGQQVRVTYRPNVGDATRSRLQIRPFTGSPGQTADAVLTSLFPGKITSAHKFTGQAGVVVIGDYDPDAFPSGMPNISAVVRGSKVLDVRTGVIAWSENPALLARHVATHPLFGRQPASATADSSIAAAANVCDTATSYVVGGQTYVRPLFTAGYVARTGTRAADIIDDLCDAMAGRWVIVDGQLRMRAGGSVTPLQTLTEAWLAGAVDGQATAIDVQGDAGIEGCYNTVAGKFVDAARAYQEIDYPTVQAAEYLAADGVELQHPDGIQLPAVTFVGQAQQVVAMLMRDARMGQTIALECNMMAYAVEPFDVLRVTLARFGWVDKLFEVQTVSWTPAGTIKLKLKATDPSIWAMGTAFDAVPLSPPTRLPSPWQVPAVAGLACYSGTGELQLQADGTLISTLRVTWTPITDAYVVESGGGVEVRYGLASEPESAWRTVRAPEATGSVRITDVQDGRLYLVKARAYTSLTRGAWSLPELHQVVGKTAAPSNVSGASVAVSKGRAVWSWAIPSDADWDVIEIRASNSDWGSLSVPPLYRGRASQWPEVVTATGSLTRYMRHLDTTGNPSAATTSVTATISAGDLVQDGAPAVKQIYVHSSGFQSPSAIGAATGITPAGAGLWAAKKITLTTASDVVVTATASLNWPHIYGNTQAFAELYLQLDTLATAYGYMTIQQPCIDDITANPIVRVVFAGLSAGDHLFGLWVGGMSGIRTPAWQHADITADPTLTIEVLS